MKTIKTIGMTRREALKTGLAATAAGSGLLGALPVAFADTLADIKKRGELVTATEMQFPPFDISDNGVYKGVDRDLIDAVAKEWASRSPTSTCRGPACCPVSKRRSSISASRPSPSPKSA